MDAEQRIKEIINGNPVVLYMKGTPQFPQCGYSAKAAQLLKACGVKKFHAINVLMETPEMNQAVCDFADWPTWPKLYIRGEFVGGCDIMTDMFQSGELQQALEGLTEAV